jgi:hypothetical protein
MLAQSFDLGSQFLIERASAEGFPLHGVRPACYLRFGSIVLRKMYPCVEFGFLRPFAHKVLRYCRFTVWKHLRRLHPR